MIIRNLSSRNLSLKDSSGNLYPILANNQVVLDDALWADVVFQQSLRLRQRDLSVGSSDAFGALLSVAYRLTSDGTTVTAYDKLGSKVASGTDGGAVLSAILPAANSSGATIEFRNDGNPFPWGSVPAIAKGITNKLLIRGNGSTIRLSSAGPRFLDFNRTADYDTFQNIELTDFIIDVNGVGGQNHIVLGGYRAGVAQNRLNLIGITIRRIRVINAPTNADVSTDHRIGLWLVSQHGSVNEATQTVVKNILVEDFVMEDNGNAGVIVTGQGPLGGVNVLVDNIILSRCRVSMARAKLQGAHATGATTLTVDSTAGFANTGQLRAMATDGAIVTITYSAKTSTTFTVTATTKDLADQTGLGYPVTSCYQVGGRAHGGRALLQQLSGSNSGDNGIETNAMTYALHDDCHFSDNLNLGFYQQNYQTATYPNGQRIVYRDCSFRRTDPSLSAPAFSIGDQSVSPLNSVVYERCRIYIDADNSFGTGGAAINAAVAGGTAPNVREIIVRDFKVYHVVTATLTSNRTPSYFWFRPLATCSIVLHNPDITVTGTVIPGAFNASTRGFNFSGTDTIIRGFGGAFDFNVTGTVSATTRAMIFGADASTVIRGSWDSFTIRQIAGDANPRAIRISSNATLDANHTLTFSNWDFSKMTSGAEVLYDAITTQGPYVNFVDTRWFGNPRVSAAMSAASFAAATFTSATGNQYLAGFPALLQMTGGAGVTSIDVSVDGTTYRNIWTQASGALSQTVQFYIRNGWFVKVTFATTQPATVVIPIQ